MLNMIISARLEKGGSQTWSIVDITARSTILATCHLNFETSFATQVCPVNLGEASVGDILQIMVSSFSGATEQVAWVGFEPQNNDIIMQLQQNKLLPGVLLGMTDSIGGSALNRNACSVGTTIVKGATPAMVVDVAPVLDPNPLNSQNYDWYGYVSATDTVTVKLCALVAGVPSPTNYRVRLVQ
jgi:hypothetical protein